MADITGALMKFNDVELTGESPLTEAVLNKFGANVNGMIDAKAYLESELRLVSVIGAATGYTLNTAVTILSLTVTLAAGDVVVLDLGSVGAGFTNGNFSISASNGAANTGASMSWKRGATVLQTKSAGPTSFGVTVTAAGRFIDKPGAGTYTYTFELNSTNAAIANYTGYAMMRKGRA